MASVIEQNDPGIAKQSWDPAVYARNARFVSDLGAPLLALLDAKAGERVLDLGCGDGVLTARLVECGCTVVGVDASPAMVEAARSRGLDVRVMDGRALTFSEEFDAVFSNAALHWMLAPRRVLAGVRRALKPGGRFVAEFGGDGNVDAIVRALHMVLLRRGKDVPKPWFFPSPEEYRRLLESEGFTIRLLARLPRPTLLLAGVEAWLETFAQPFTAAFAPDERRSVLREVAAMLGETMRDSEGRWWADYVRLWVHAVKV